MRSDLCASVATIPLKTYDPSPRTFKNNNLNYPTPYSTMASNVTVECYSLILEFAGMGKTGREEIEDLEVGEIICTICKMEVDSPETFLGG